MDLKQHLHAWLDSFVAWGAKTKTVAVLGLATVSWLAWELISSFASDVIVAFRDRYVRDPVIWLLGRPIGWVMLFVVGWVLLLAALSWYATTPFAAARRERRGNRRPLTERESRTVERLREEWNPRGRNAGVRIIWALSAMRDYTDELPTPFRRLLRYPQDVLASRFEALEEALDPDARVQLPEVKRRLADYLLAYYEGVRWMHVGEFVYPALPEAEFFRQGYATWKQDHALFEAQLRKMGNGGLWPEVDQYLRNASATELRFAKDPSRPNQLLIP